jgi:hypothetical protein
MNILKSEIKLFKNSQKLSKFLGQHNILLYLFANTPFKFGSICSIFMVNDSQKSFHLVSKKSRKLRHFLTE